MNYSIRGENIDVTDSIKKYLKDKISKFEKYFDDPSKVNIKVIISVKGREQKVEITIVDINRILRAEVSHSDMYAAIDLAIDKLNTQFRKFKSKLISQSKISLIPDIDDFDDEELETIVKRKKVYLKPMDENEAIFEMELLGHNFFVFKNIVDEKVNIIYKRTDGSYGIIETN